MNLTRFLNEFNTWFLKYFVVLDLVRQNVLTCRRKSHGLFLPQGRGRSPRLCVLVQKDNKTTYGKKGIIVIFKPYDRRTSSMKDSCSHRIDNSLRLWSIWQQIHFSVEGIRLLTHEILAIYSFKRHVYMFCGVIIVYRKRTCLMIRKDSTCTDVHWNSVPTQRFRGVVSRSGQIGDIPNVDESKVLDRFFQVFRLTTRDL